MIQEFLWTNQNPILWFVSLSSPCLILILPFVCRHVCADADASSLTFLRRRSVGNVCCYCIYHHHHCYLLSPEKPLSTYRYAAADSSWWIFCLLNGIQDTHTAPPPFSFNTSRTTARPGNDQESIISDDAVIEATTSNTMLPWLFFSFTFIAQLKDELCKEVYYLSVGINKDAAAFSSESPFVVSKMDLETAVMCACSTFWVHLCHCVNRSPQPG